MAGLVFIQYFTLLRFKLDGLPGPSPLPPPLPPLPSPRPVSPLAVRTGGLEQSRAAYHLQVDVHLASGSNLLPLPKLLLLMLLLYIGDPTAAHTPEPDV